MKHEFSNPAGVIEAIRRAQRHLDPSFKTPEQRAREHLLEAAEAVRAALPMPEGWRAEKKIRNLADRLFPLNEEIEK